jgi:hypothetical protein
MAKMTKSERADFRAFVENATDTQVLNILNDETERAEREEAKGDGSDYYATCKEIARAEAARRDLYSE